VLRRRSQPAERIARGQPRRHRLQQLQEQWPAGWSLVPSAGRVTAGSGLALGCSGSRFGPGR
jgi:hypothetical protein